MSEPLDFDAIIAKVTSAARLLIATEFHDLANGVERPNSMAALSAAAGVLEQYDRETP